MAIGASVRRIAWSDVRRAETQAQRLLPVVHLLDELYTGHGPLIPELVEASLELDLATKLLAGGQKRNVVDRLALFEALSGRFLNIELRGLEI